MKAERVCRRLHTRARADGSDILLLPAGATWPLVRGALTFVATMPAGTWSNQIMSVAADVGNGRRAAPPGRCCEARGDGVQRPAPQQAG